MGDIDNGDILSIIQKLLQIIEDNNSCDASEISRIAKFLGKEHNKCLQNVLNKMASEYEQTPDPQRLIINERNKAFRKKKFLKLSAQLYPNCATNLLIRERKPISINSSNKIPGLDSDANNFLRDYWGEDSIVYKILKEVFNIICPSNGSSIGSFDGTVLETINKKFDSMIEKINSKELNSDAKFMLLATIYTLKNSAEYFYSPGEPPIDIIKIISNSTIPEYYSASSGNSNEIYNDALLRAGPGWLIADGEAAAVGFTCVGFLGPATPAGCVGVVVGAGLSSSWQALKDWW